MGESVVMDGAAGRPPANARGHGEATWGLPPGAAEDVQGLVVSPFAHLEESTALFLRIGRGGAWLLRLLDAGMVTDATGKVEACTAVALTASGLRSMQLPGDVMDTFAPPFTEGMTEKNRHRRLGDADPRMLWTGKLEWSGDEAGPGQVVHALLLLYAATPDALQALTAKALALIEPEGVSVAFTLPLTLHPFGGGKGALPREHFGFADGFSQPLPHADPQALDPLHGVPLGEVLMGYRNAHREPAPAPTVDESLPGSDLLGTLGMEGEPGQVSLGANGSYLTVRQLHQNVAAFRASMARAAAALNDPAITAEWLAERVVGRERDGDLLVPGGALPARSPGRPDNEFGFFDTDRHGYGCPLGSHIRRANPRDGLAKDESRREGMRTAANNHRILRRGRKYGDVLPDGAPDDGAARGLLFMCLQTDIARQFEFIQQTWLLNPVFACLSDETDPLLGPAGPFTLPADPLRRIADVETFVRLVGGEYFFLPSLRALRYLGGLPA